LVWSRLSARTFADIRAELRSKRRRDAVSPKDTFIYGQTHC
jgi:hypothetical protein